MKKLLLRGLSLVNSPAAKSIYILISGNLADSVFAFLFTILAFRALTTSDFGIFSALNNFVFTSVLILDLGLGGALLHFVPILLKKSRPREAGRYFKIAVTWRMVTSGLVCLLLIILSPVIGPGFFRTSNVSPVIFTALAIVVVSFLDILNFTLQSYRKFLASALSSNSFSFFRYLILQLGIIFRLPVNVGFLMLVTVVSPWLGLILALFWLGWPVFTKPDRINTRKLLGFSGGLALYRISSTVATRSDIQIILLRLGPDIAGIYSVAARLANFYPVIIGSLLIVLSSRLSVISDMPHLKTFLSKSALGIIVLVSAMIFGILIARPLILLLFGPNSAPAVPYFRGLTLAYLPLISAIIPLALLIYKFHRPRTAGIIGLVQLLTTVSFGWLLVPFLGVFGPIVALGLSHTLVLFASLAIVKSLWTSESSVRDL